MFTEVRGAADALKRGFWDSYATLEASVLDSNTNLNEIAVPVPGEDSETENFDTPADAYFLPFHAVDERLVFPLEDPTRPAR